MPSEALTACTVTTESAGAAGVVGTRRGDGLGSPGPGRAARLTGEGRGSPQDAPNCEEGVGRHPVKSVATTVGVSGP
jgi:hypothetical protein